MSFIIEDRELMKSFKRKPQMMIWF